MFKNVFVNKMLKYQRSNRVLPKHCFCVPSIENRFPGLSHKLKCSLIHKYNKEL